MSFTVLKLPKVVLKCLNYTFKIILSEPCVIFQAALMKKFINEKDSSGLRSFVIYLYGCK